MSGFPGRLMVTVGVLLACVGIFAGIAALYVLLNQKGEASLFSLDSLLLLLPAGIAFVLGAGLTLFSHRLRK